MCSTDFSFSEMVYSSGNRSAWVYQKYCVRKQLQLKLSSQKTIGLIETGPCSLPCSITHWLPAQNTFIMLLGRKRQFE